MGKATRAFSALIKDSAEVRRGVTESGDRFLEGRGASHYRWLKNSEARVRHQEVVARFPRGRGPGVIRYQ